MPNDFERRQRQFDKRFDFQFKLVGGFIIFVFVCIVLYWGFIGYIAVKAVNSIGSSDPKEVAHSVGEVVKAFNEGASK